MGDSYEMSSLRFREKQNKTKQKNTHTHTHTAATVVTSFKVQILTDSILKYFLFFCGNETCNCELLISFANKLMSSPISSEKKK